MTDAEHNGWVQADRILDQLLELPPRFRRAQLAGMDLPEALRARVDRLLDAMEDSDGLLDHPERVLPSLTMHALRGRRMGRWELEAEIGRGGVAVVYRACSIGEPAGQVAAIKILTLGALADAGRDQFLREQQMLLRLRHPYIAPLYDAGIADDGTPWLAMALVEGTRIDDWCAAHTLDARARVRLVLQVCEAVAHAHRSLVIHRDIKPSNVLVDQDGRVRLLDFGIARLGDGGGERTATALRALTPEYAAPEQFTGAPATTAMDVYGIGALLYRLLAGVGPRPDGARDGAITGQLPSRAAAGNAALSQAMQRRLVRSLRGDLDAIVMKTLATEPTARYPSVEALADDLCRWLDGLPVRARPPSLVYRARRFIVRNRLILAAASLVLLVLCGGVVGTVWQMHRAQVAADRANAALARAERAREESDAHRKYLARALAVLVPTGAADRELDRGRIIDALTQHADSEFADKPALLASVELDLGMIAHNLGDSARATALLQSALRRRLALYGPDNLLTAEAQAQAAKAMRVGDDADFPAAERLIAQAVDTMRRRDAPVQTLLPTLLVWSVALQEQAREDEARARLDEAAALCDGPLQRDALCERVWLYRGLLAERSSRPHEAIAALQPLYAFRRDTYGADHASTLIAGAQLGRNYLGAGEVDQGVALLEEVLAAQRDLYPEGHTEILWTTFDLARGRVLQGRLDEARAQFSWYLDQTRARQGERHFSVANGYLGLATVELADARSAQAAELAARAHGIFSDVTGKDSPGAMAANGYRADALRDVGRLAEAEMLHRKALEQAVAAYGEQDPRVASRSAALARTLVLRGEAAAALPLYDRALALYRAARAHNPSSIGFSATRAARSRALLALGNDTGAIAQVRAAVAEMEQAGAASRREYGNAVAWLTDSACRTEAADCDLLRSRSRALAARPHMQGHPQQLLARAGAGRPLD